MPVIANNDSLNEAVRPRRGFLAGFFPAALALLAFFPRLSRAMSQSSVGKGRTAAVLPASRRFEARPPESSIRRNKR